MKRSSLFAGLFFLWGLFIATTSFAADGVVITAKARVHFKAGVAYIDDPTGPKYEEAYREFKLAYAESPTYKILTNLGLCALNLERDGEAISSYEGFLAQATAEDIPKNKRTLMERDISMLKASLVSITVSSVPANVILSDERIPSKGSNVINRYELKAGKLALGIHPGHHRITASAEGYEPQTWDFEADSASTHEHAFNLKATATIAAAANAPSASRDVAASPEPPRTKKTPTLVYVGAAATGVFAIGATVTGLIAHSKKSDYESLNRTGEDPRKASELKDSGKLFALVTDIGIGAAILSAAGTAIIYFTAPSSKVETKATASRFRVEPTVGQAQAGISVSGQF